MSLEETVKDVKKQLMEAGEKLLTPPSGTDELLSLLDLVDNALGKVEQSPGKAMHDALTSLRKALVSDELLGHLDTDVKVFVASCISEITRITAPDAPYDDEDMKRVFQLIVSSFEDLSDQSSRSYNKRVSILETVAKVRSCVIMLDLECDDLISEMFQIFFRTIRDYHPDCIFISMEIIMNLVLEESEEVSTDLITTLLSSVKRDDEEVPPIARRLGERILGTSAAKLKPYLIQATKNSDISLHNYSKILTSVCEGTVGRDAKDALVQQPSDGCKATEASIDGTQEGGGCKVAAASVEPTQENDGDNVAVASSEETQVGDLTKASAASSEETLEDAKDVRRDSLGDNSHTAKRSPKTTMNNGTNVASKEKTSINGESSLKGDNCETTMNNGTNVASKEKTSINGELSLKGDNCETDNKSTNDEAIPKPESHALGVEEEAKVPDNLDSHEKDTVSSLDEDICPEPKNVESDEETADVEARNGFKDSNAASPSPSAEKDNENLLKRDGHQLGKDCPTQGEVSSPGRITEKESERASDSEEASGESPDKKAQSPDKKAHQECPLKDETSFEAATPKHEDSGTSDSEDKSIKERTKKLDLRDSDDDGAPSKGKTDLIKHARTKARTGKGAPKSEKESEKASDSEEASDESPDKKAHQESPLNDETSVEVATSKHEDSGTSDSEYKLVKEPTEKFDLRDSDDDGVPLKKKADLIKRARTKARTGNGASKSEKESEKTSDSEEASGESPDKKAYQESPLKDETSVEVATSEHEDSDTSDSEDKLVKEPTKKFDFRDSDDDGAPLKKKADLIKRALTKARPGKGASKSSTKDDVKEVGSSLKRTSKSAKAEENEDEIFSKRKRSLGKDSSGPLKYGKNLIRSKVKVWWPMDHQFYEGVIVSYDPDKRKHKVLYDDGEDELLNLRKEKWQLVGDDSVTVTDDDAEPPSTDTSSEMPKSKKVKKSATSFDFDDVSPKRKSKGKSSASGKRTKNVKSATKSKDVTSKFASPKSYGKAKDLDNSTLRSKSKQDTPKIAGKSKEDTLKSGGKSREDTPKTTGKSKEDTPKTAVSGKTQGSGNKSTANGTGKGKSSLSKGKGSHVQEKRSESPEVPESTKRKMSNSSKDLLSGAKSAKKQKRSIKG